MSGITTSLWTLHTGLTALNQTSRSSLLAAKAGAGCAEMVRELAVALIKPMEGLVTNAPRLKAFAQVVRTNGGGANLFEAETLVASYHSAVQLQNDVDAFGAWADLAAAYYAECHENLTALAKWTSDASEEAKARIGVTRTLRDADKDQTIVDTVSGIQRWLDGVASAVAGHNTTWTAGFEQRDGNAETSQAHLLLHTEITDHLSRMTFHVQEAGRKCGDAIAGKQS